jgi:hypothetical protein
MGNSCNNLASLIRVGKIELNYLFFGHSHLAAIQSAVTDADKERIRFENLARTNDHSFPSMDRLREIRKEFEPVDVLCICQRGNAHNIISLFNHPQRFIMAPNAGKATFIPRDMMTAQFEADLKPRFQEAATLIEVIGARVNLVFAPPPPGADQEHIRQYPGVFATKYPILFERNLQLNISPDSLRRQVYDVEVAVTAMLGESIGATFVPCPEAAFDERGMLARAFWANDPVHANSKYGKLVLAGIFAKVEATA